MVRRPTRPSHVNGRQEKANSNSTLYNHRYVHCNTYTYLDDSMMLGMSTYLKLTLSYIKPSLGRLREVTATIGVPSASAPDHISNLGYVFDSVPISASTAATVA